MDYRLIVYRPTTGLLFAEQNKMKISLTSNDVRQASCPTALPGYTILRTNNINSFEPMYNDAKISTSVCFFFLFFQLSYLVHNVTRNVMLY